MAHPDPALSRPRRYILGEASEDESAAIELEYFGDEQAIDRMASIEEDLIDDYLDGRLTGDERLLFERRYLASPVHRRRVATLRRLTSMSGQSGGGAKVIAPAPRQSAYAWIGLAAALILTTAALWWFAPPRRETPALSAGRPASPPAAEARSTRTGSPKPPAARIIALSLAPIGVRGAADSPTLDRTGGVDDVILRLEGEGPAVANARVSIRTVSGGQVWEGAASAAAPPSAGVVAQVKVPADRLGVEDYVVALFETDAPGVERERYRYFLRVRSR